MKRSFRILLAAMICAGPVYGQAQAADGCDCFALTAWTEDTGLPSGNILAMTQDREGYLWLGMNRQLVRFDGWQFDVWGSNGEPDLPGSFITALVSAQDGSIWVGFGDVDAVSQVRNERLTNYSAADGVPLGPVADLLEDRDGAIWAGGRGGLAVFRGSTWTRVRLRGRPREVEVTSLFETDEGAVLIGTSQGIFRISPGRSDIEHLPGSPVSVRSMAQDESGNIWVADSQLIVRRLDDAPPVGYAEEVDVPSSGWRLLRDRQGTMWIAGLGGGLFRVDTRRAAGRQLVDRFNYEQEFPDGRAGGARSLLVDRDDNVWVGMRAGGLLRISRTLLQSAIPLEGLTNDGVRGLAASPDGSVWVATGRSLNRFIGAERIVYDLQRTSTLHSDREGRLWIVTSAGISMFADGRLSTLALPAGIRFGRIISVAVDSSGALWLCSNEQGTFRWANERLASFDAEPAVSGEPCTFVLADGRGRVWIGFAAGGVALFQRDHFRRYGKADGLAGGSVSAILEDSRGAIWISTTSGLSRFQSGRFVTIGPKDGLPDQLAPGLVEDSEGYLWLSVNSGSGAIRLNPAEVDRIAEAEGLQVRYTLYDETDGFLGELLRLTRPAAVRGTDGALWFLSGHSVVMFEPTKLRPRGEVGPARVVGALVNGQEMSPEEGATLPARISSLRIEYTAADLSAASKLRFRYRLDGVTDGWVDAGSRRYAEFTNLEAGNYRFRVVTLSGTRDDPDETVWEFSVGQLFYRTTEFYLLAGCGMAGVLGATWWLRLRVMRRQFALVLAERVRISREIHDVLIQDMVAIGFELEWLAGEYEQPRRESPSRALRALRQRIRTSVNEARRSILELRSGRLESHGLVEALEEYIESVRSQTPPRIGLAVEGSRQRCPIFVEEQIMRIAVEAISNALRHAGASAIDVVLAYRPGELSLVVSDDGCGFERDEIDRSAGQHWGLQSMGERANRLGGSLEIQTGTGRGTTVTVNAPVTDNAA